MRQETAASNSAFLLKFSMLREQQEAILLTVGVLGTVKWSLVLNSVIN